MTTPAISPAFEERELVVAFFDLTTFVRYCRTHPWPSVIANLTDYYEWVGELVAQSGGQVIKFIGDAGLLAYPIAEADAAVNALLRLKTEGDAWWTARSVNTTNLIKAHCGPVYCGLAGTRTDKRFDIFGDTVNTTATLPAHGLAISPELFRKLAPATRQHFKKHTPPVTYIPVEERHRD